MDIDIDALRKCRKLLLSLKEEADAIGKTEIDKIITTLIEPKIKALGLKSASSL